MVIFNRIYFYNILQYQINFYCVIQKHVYNMDIKQWSVFLYVCGSYTKLKTQWSPTTRAVPLDMLKFIIKCSDGNWLKLKLIVKVYQNILHLDVLTAKLMCLADKLFPLGKWSHLVHNRFLHCIDITKAWLMSHSYVQLLIY